MQASLKRELSDGCCTPAQAKKIRVSDESPVHNDSLGKMDQHVIAGPTFYPSLDEFVDPLLYIAKIRPLAEKFGICKIIPPNGWELPDRDRNSNPIPFVARVQNLHSLRNGKPFPDGNTYTYSEYRAEMDHFKATKFPELVYSAENHIRVKEYNKKNNRGTNKSECPYIALSPYGDSQFVMCRVCGKTSEVKVDPYYQKSFMNSDMDLDCKSCQNTSLIHDFSYPIEDTYWHIVKNHGRTRSPLPTDGSFVSKIPTRLTVEYANDQNVRKVGSVFPQLPRSYTPTPMVVTAFDERSRLPPVANSIPGRVTPNFHDPLYYTMTPWNLNSMPFLPGSLLKYLPDEIDGLTNPWLYMGGLFSTFAWHNEDHYLYSVNYMAKGEGKVWYGVPGSQSSAFENKMLSVLDPEVVKKNPKIIYSITAMVPPDELVGKGVQICRLVQEPGTFIVTFPAAYHAGFSCGWNVAEAVNMALPDWLPFGRKAILNYENQDGVRCGRPPCFSHDMLLLTLVRRALDDAEVAIKQLETNYLRLLRREFLHVIQQEMIRRESSCIMNQVKETVILSERESLFKRECKRCRTFCWFTAVTCGSCPEEGRKKKFSCLLHAETHCNNHDNLLLFEWVSLETLTKLLTQVEIRLCKQ